MTDFNLEPNADEAEIEAESTIRSIVADEFTDLPLKQLLMLYQHMRGLKADGLMGKRTIEESERHRFCAVKDNLSGTRARWDHTAWDGKAWRNGKPVNMLLRYHVASALAPLTKKQTDACVAKALSGWTAVCAVVFEPVPTPEGANLLLSAARIDKAGGILAQFELPYGKDTPNTTLSGEFDTSERWTDAEKPGQNQIGLLHVCTHEVGHGLGLEHLPEGNLLAPYYDPNIFTPQKGDIDEAQLRYGPPVPVVAQPGEPPVLPPIPPGNPGTKIPIDMNMGGVRYLGTVTPQQS